MNNVFDEGTLGSDLVNLEHLSNYGIVCTEKSKKEMIRQLQFSELNICLSVISESHATVADEFNLTKDNCPNHTSFIDMQRLEYHWNNNYLMFGYFKDNNIIGYVSLSRNEDRTFELHNLSVIPKFRHYGYGKELIKYCIDKVKELGGTKIEIGIIEENTKLKNWYMKNGFIHTDTRKFEHLPFTVGFMEMKI